ncbi:MAG: 30S ribosomal protein S7 [Chlorobi bacterium]|nr:MAG: 30S ribosomal protein S7 [Bacteroidota bacterium]KXK36067.1 MAG: 30S ribosomal protein S7 [Chlorobi bacterium OLB6]MBE2266420.1 30S ribosomal protein S7 [Flavobacteriales bacterium]MBL1160330.1 30S ribosomal protein S7 [Chlorobiota bacterium]MBW7854375.1 30S ribosomal protein S7 [Candidatus Kapabacteria bacterium]MCC6331717.1 30S ribosomal protein S7 [Ignavibacteria bacterium]
MRKKRSDKRRTSPDPRYNDVTLAKFVNNVMEDGNKSKARAIVYEAFSIVADKTKEEPLEVFRRAMQNVGPAIEIRPRRVGGATYQVPMEVREERRIALAIRWIKKFASERRERTMASKLANEIMAAAGGEGGAIRRRDEMHRMADANRAFSHFRW